MKLIEKPVNFIREVKVELGKVSWSTRQELISSTMVVITITAILTVFIGIVDITLSKFLTVVFR